MAEQKSKKKKLIIIVVSSIVAILLCIGIVGFIWYQNSPVPTALKMAKAFKVGDINTVLDYIEPETEKKIEAIINLTGMSANDLFDKLFSAKSHEEDELDDNTTNISMKLSCYKQEGNNASISVIVTNGDTTSSWDIHFVRISKKWYWSLI